MEPGNTKKFALYVKNEVEMVKQPLEKVDLIEMGASSGSKKY